MTPLSRTGAQPHSPAARQVGELALRRVYPVRYWGADAPGLEEVRAAPAVS